MSINTNIAAMRTADNLRTHYLRLATSTRRLSSGLRVNSSADDAAGLAIREMMRSEVSTLNQGMRNANDAISLLQVADAALGIIDEKLIRMKELAEQAATGTYDSTQRLMIFSEFQAMGSEIDRIARATEFNGIKLLDGSLSGAHDGSGLNARGAMKIHFGTGNDSAEDYYYINIPAASLAGLHLTDPLQVEEEVVVVPGEKPEYGKFETSHITAAEAAKIIMGNGIAILDAAFTGAPQALGKYVGAGSAGMNNAMNEGVILSTGDVLNANNPPGEDESSEWNGDGDPLINSGDVPQFDAAMLDVKFRADSDMLYFNFVFATDEWPQYLNQEFNDVCSIILDGDPVNGNYARLENIVGVNGQKPPANLAGAINLNNIFNNPDLFVDNTQGDNFQANGFSHVFRIGIPVTPNQEHTLHFSVVDLGDTAYDSWIMVNGMSVDAVQTEYYPAQEVGRLKTITTQEKAQEMLVKIDDAIVTKDKIRAHIGALQNRFENTATNLSIQAENLLAAESRISDADVAMEMMRFVREQILTQSAVAMLSQANNYPQMLAGLIRG